MSTPRGPWTPQLLAVVAVLDIAGLVLLVSGWVLLGIALICLGGIVVSVTLVRHQLRLADRPGPDR